MILDKVVMHGKASVVTYCLQILIMQYYNKLLAQILYRVCQFSVYLHSVNHECCNWHQSYELLRPLYNTQYLIHS